MALQSPLPDPAPPTGRHACAECHLVFPESMMKQVGHPWYCLSCDASILDSGVDRRNRNVEAKRSVSLPKWVLWAGGAVLLVALYVIPRVLIPQHHTSSMPELLSEGAEPWSKMPPEQWPKFTLRNELHLQGVPPAPGGSGFLLDAGDGQIVGVIHARREALGKKEDEPTLTNAELNQRYVSGRMFTPETPERAIAFRGFFGPPTAHSDGDVWLLRAADDKAPLPATPLKLRHMVSLRGMHLFVIARLAGDASGREQAFPCTAQDVGTDGAVTKIAYDSAVVSRGFAGAPVVDTHGHLAAIVTGIGEEEMNENGAVTWLNVAGATNLLRSMQ